MCLAKMQENGAAMAGDRRIVVKAKLDDKVEVILAPHLLVAGGEGKRNKPVVAGSPGSSHQPSPS